MKYRVEGTIINSVSLEVDADSPSLALCAALNTWGEMSTSMQRELVDVDGDPTFDSVSPVTEQRGENGG